MRLHSEELRVVRSLVLPGQFGEQMEVLNNRVEEAIRESQKSEQMLALAARRLTVLVGEMHASSATRIFDCSEQALHSLRILGMRLTDELQCLRNLQKEKLREHGTEAVGSSSRRITRAWRPVETQHYCLFNTTDPDTIRGLRGASQHGAHHQAAAGAAERAPEEVEDEEQEEAPVVHATPFQDVWHGGPEGRYIRDPLTGAWGRRRDGLDGTTNVELGLGGPRVSA
mmetsp:Transcript_133561/g.260074  ORF Transcript_133561/g.260074 Transcript_133561/m.260074 type:complete len:227 (-) Transcript_133561:331-1011(-)